MANRTFWSASGEEWSVWDVVPLGIPSDVVRLLPEFGDGWLTFYHAHQWRRLSPIPAGWQSMSDAELDELRCLARAAPQRPRS